MSKLFKIYHVKVGRLEDAVAFFKDRLGMVVEQDFILDQEICLLVKPNPALHIFLSSTSNERQTNQITLFTNDCLEDYYRFKEKGIIFNTPPTYGNEGLCAIFADPFGNEYTLLEKRIYGEF